MFWVNYNGHITEVGGAGGHPVPPTKFRRDIDFSPSNKGAGWPTEGNNKNKNKNKSKGPNWY